MVDLLIRNIPDALKQKIEHAAKRDGQSLSAKTVDLLRNSLTEEEGAEKPFVSGWEVLRPLLYDGNEEEARAYSEIMEEIEAERKRDLGRPVPDFE